MMMIMQGRPGLKFFIDTIFGTPCLTQSFVIIIIDSSTGCHKTAHNFVQVMFKFETRYMNKLCLV